MQSYNGTFTIAVCECLRLEAVSVEICVGEPDAFSSLKDRRRRDLEMLSYAAVSDKDNLSGLLHEISQEKFNGCLFFFCG